MLRLKLIEEVSLVFIVVFSPDKQVALVAFPYPRIMTCGDIVRAERLGMSREGVELDLPIAQHVGIGRAPLFVFFYKMSEYSVIIFLG